MSKLLVHKHWYIALITKATFGIQFALQTLLFYMETIVITGYNKKLAKNINDITYDYTLWNIPEQVFYKLDFDWHVLKSVHRVRTAEHGDTWTNILAKFTISWQFEFRYVFELTFCDVLVVYLFTYECKYNYMHFQGHMRKKGGDVGELASDSALTHYILF